MSEIKEPTRLIIIRQNELYSLNNKIIQHYRMFKLYNFVNSFCTLKKGQIKEQAGQFNWALTHHSTSSRRQFYSVFHTHTHNHGHVQIVDTMITSGSSALIQIIKMLSIFFKHEESLQLQAHRLPTASQAKFNKVTFLDSGNKSRFWKIYCSRFHYLVDTMSHSPLSTTPLAFLFFNAYYCDVK